VNCVVRDLSLLFVSCVLVACGRVDVYAISAPSEPSVSMLGSTPAPPLASGPTDGGMPDSALGNNCGMATLSPGDTTLSLQVGGVRRSYLLHVPSAYDGRQAVPLIVDFHGMGGTAESGLASSTYPPITDREGVIQAFPNGLKGPLGSAWNMGPCCVEGADDLAFTRALVAQVQALACIDAGRIYAVGVLTGGGMVNNLACNAADVFAAISPAAFDLLQETVDDCKPALPVTVVSFRGTADTRVPYAGGASSLVPGMPITFLGAQASFARWAAINTCNGEPSAEDTNGCATYSNCAGGVEVFLCTNHGGGEDPGDASISWRILARHTR
jgi:polyhydroxybutyrate depolymerase